MKILKKSNYGIYFILILVSFTILANFVSKDTNLSYYSEQRIKEPRVYPTEHYQNSLNAKKLNNSTTLYDLETKSENIIENLEDPIDDSFLEVQFKSPFDGLAPSEDNLTIECNYNTFTGKPESIIGDDDRVRITPTTSYPWRTICKLYMTWGAIDSVGSGALIDESHVLTAGHCVYDNDLGGWADSIRVVPGMDNGNEPYGHAWATQMRIYNDWINYKSEEHDFAVITLDDDIGLQTGWMGLESHPVWSSIYNQGLNLAGYPADLDGGVNLYHDYNLGTYANEYNHWYIIDTSGGQSGSPIWRYDGTNRYILTIHAYSNDGSGANHGTRIDFNKYYIINNWIQADKTLTDKPDLANRGDLYSGFSPTTVGSGLTTFNVWCDIQNLGTSSTEGFTVSYYASFDPAITQDDFFIGVDTLNSINPTDNSDSSWSGTFPNDIPSGNYYIGWIIDTQNTVDEFNEYNNIGIISTYQLLVDASPPSNPTSCLQINGTTESGIWQDGVDDPEFIWGGSSDFETSIGGYYVYWGKNPSGISSTFSFFNGYDPTKVSNGTYYLRVRTQDEVGNNASWINLYIFRYNETLNDDQEIPINLPIENRSDHYKDESKKESFYKIYSYDLFFILGFIGLSIFYLMNITKNHKVIKE